MAPGDQHLGQLRRRPGGKDRDVFSGNLEGTAQRGFCLLEISSGPLCDAERAEGRRGQFPVVETPADGNGGLRGPDRLDSSAEGRQGLGPEAERVRLVL